MSILKFSVLGMPSQQPLAAEMASLSKETRYISPWKLFQILYPLLRLPSQKLRVCIVSNADPYLSKAIQREGGRENGFDSKNYLLACSTATAQATVAPTIGLLPIPISPIISTWAGTEEEPANWASPCIRPMESVKP